MSPLKITVGAVLLLSAAGATCILWPDPLPRFPTEGTSVVHLAPLPLTARLPLDHHVSPRGEDRVSISERCYERGGTAPAIGTCFRYAPPWVGIQAHGGQPNEGELAELGRREGFERHHAEANDGRTEVVYERRDTDFFETVSGFVRVGSQWYDFECHDEDYEGGAAAYRTCMSTLVSLEPSGRTAP